jgi:hypothetical protein
MEHLPNCRAQASCPFHFVHCNEQITNASENLTCGLYKVRAQHSTITRLGARARFFVSPAPFPRSGRCSWLQLRSRPRGYGRDAMHTRTRFRTESGHTSKHCTALAAARIKAWNHLTPMPTGQHGSTGWHDYGQYIHIYTHIYVRTGQSLASRERERHFVAPGAVRSAAMCSLWANAGLAMLWAHCPC